MPMAAGACWRGERGDNESGVPLVGFPFFFYGSWDGASYFSVGRAGIFFPNFPRSRAIFYLAACDFLAAALASSNFFGGEKFSRVRFMQWPHMSVRLKYLFLYR